MRRLVGHITAIAVLTLVGLFPSMAQNNPVIGNWSTTSYTSDGQAFASFFMQLAPNGQIRQRIITKGGTSDYFGTYQFDPSRSLVQYVMQDYQPKFIPPTIQLGAPYDMQVQFTNANTMIVMDASGPMEYHRQP